MWDLNKKGETGNQLISLTYIFLMVIIAFGITAGISIFFGAEYQFKQVDSDSLYLKVVKCIRENDDTLFNDFYSKCGINKDVVGNYSKIKICSGSENCVAEADSQKIKFIIGGDFQSCDFSGIKGNNNFARCTKGVVETNGNSYQIITGSRQVLRRIA
jgi:hypothetical protein